MRQKGCVTWRSRSEMNHLWGTEDKLLVRNFPAQRRKRDRLRRECGKTHRASHSTETSCIYASAGMNGRQIETEGLSKWPFALSCKGDLWQDPIQQKVNEISLD